MKEKKEKIKPYEEAWAIIKGHYLLSVIAERISIRPWGKIFSASVELNPKSFGYVEVTNNSEAIFWVNKEAKASKEEWQFVFATLMIILGLDLYKMLDQQLITNEPEEENYYKEINEPKYNLLQENAVFLFAINYVSTILNINEYPKQWANFYKVKEDVSFKNEKSVFEQLENKPQLHQLVEDFNLRLIKKPSLFFNHRKTLYGRWQTEFAQVFAENLVNQAKKTIALRTNVNLSQEQLAKRNTLGYKSLRWIINHYPLLSSLASQFDLVEDIKVCQRNDIQIAAVSAVEKTIFINPLAGLNEQSMRFVIAHEILHIALNHISRGKGRDFATWNLACDFVINHWLVAMNVGVPPEHVYLDKSLSGKSADEIYVLINQDVRLKKKLGTLKNTGAGSVSGRGGCDMLDNDPRYFGEFEDACKETLLRGMFLHESLGRGDLPADLIEEIKAINQPAIPWQVDLARWIAERFPLEESKKTYARPSRRQSATPDIPRARYIRPNDDKVTRTFGVLLDTSGSMDRELLGKCLGAIAAYSAAQEVKYIRLIFCDAQPYDEGYVSVDILSQKVKVKGRGGTVLQQAVNYLENSQDFPDNAPILILTDGFVEEDLKVTRDHAFLVPNKNYLPFRPSGEVFEFK